MTSTRHTHGRKTFVAITATIAKTPADQFPPPWGRDGTPMKKADAFFMGTRGGVSRGNPAVQIDTPLNPNTMPDRIFTYDNPQLTANGRQLRQNMTPAERIIWKHLRGKRLGGRKFRRQQPFGGYILDFVCLEAKLVIEIDGGQHAGQIDYDEQRTRYLETAGFTVLRFWNNEVLQQTNAVLAAIWQKLEVVNA